MNAELRRFAIRGPLIWPDGRLRPGTLVVEEGKIAQLTSDAASGIADTPIYDVPSGSVVGPGLIDLHFHGANGDEFMDGDSAANQRILQFAASRGATSVLASLVTGSNSAISAGLAALATSLERVDAEGLERRDGGSRVLGAHLEGPYLSEHRAGAQDPENIRLPDVGEFRRWATIAPIRMISFAPELRGAAELVAIAADEVPGCVLAAGHTDATLDEMNQAFATGVRHLTHFFCGMRGFHHREPGVVGAGLMNPGYSLELIADGIHVHPAVLAWMSSDPFKTRTVLVTDSGKFCGLPDGHYSKGGRDYEVKDGSVRLADGTLAGSLLTLNGAVRNLVRLGVAVPDAWAMASVNPARVLGLADTCGSLAEGTRADITILDANFDAIATFVAGRLVWQHTSWTSVRGVTYGDA